MEEQKKYLVVDGNNLLYSSYHVSQKLTWKIKNGTIFIFLRVLISILKKGNYQKLLITFDGGGTNFRETLLPQYKAQRMRMPDELWKQLGELKILLEKIGITYIQIIDCEADDLIASFVVQSKKAYPTAVFDIFTRDKDLLQLLGENVNILKYIEGKITHYTFNQFCQEYNFLPSNYLDYLSLLGDNVDNIAGIKGVGPVIAKKLIQQFENTENIYKNLTSLPKNTEKLLENQHELVFANKKIISLVTNILLAPDLCQKCEFNWEQWKNNEQLKKFCQENRFNSILKLLN
jgi:DNA polymerase-1